MRLFSKVSSQLSVILIVSLLSFGTSSADDLMYVRAGTLIDVQTGLLHRDQVITIRGDRIESVDDATDINIEPNAKAFKVGVKMAFGSDGGVSPHGDNGKQFAYMVEYGMTPMHALQAA